MENWGINVSIIKYKLYEVVQIIKYVITMK